MSAVTDVPAADRRVCMTCGGERQVVIKVLLRLPLWTAENDYIERRDRWRPGELLVACPTCEGDR